MHVADGLGRTRTDGVAVGREPSHLGIHMTRSLVGDDTDSGRDPFENSLIHIPDLPNSAGKLIDILAQALHLHVNARHQADQLVDTSFAWF